MKWRSCGFCSPAVPVPTGRIIPVSPVLLVTILPFVFCSSFLSLLGIIGIVYAAQVESFYNRGDYTAAAESSRTAAKWTRIAMWIAIGWVLLIVIAIVLFIVFVGSLANLEELIAT